MAGGSRYDGEAFAPNGRGPIPHATVAVLTQPANTSTTPGSPLATIYTDATLTTTAANPLQADVLGNFHFYADPLLGPFTIQVYGPQVQTPYVLADQGMPPIPGSNASLGTVTAKSLNGVKYASEFGGADLGARITAASAVAGPNGVIYVDTPGTISTAPVLALGTTCIFAPGTYTLATTWTFNHHGINCYFNGAQFNYNQDAGTAAFFFGKNLSGTVNTNGTTVTWVSGSTFSTFDIGDQIYIAGSAYNIASVDSSTQITLTATAGVQSGAAYAGFMSHNGLGSSFSPIALHDFIINYTGAGTTISTGLNFQFIDMPVITNATVIGIPRAVYLQGTLQGQFDRISSIGCKNGIILDQYVAGGATITSNQNTFKGWRINAAPAGGEPLKIQNSSFGNLFIGGDAEGNLGQIFGIIQLGAFNNSFIANDLERNGDGTAGSMDFAVTAPGNTFIGNQFQSSVVNHPASGIVASTGALGTVIENNYWVGSYTTAYNFINNATGRTAGNTTVGTFGDPLTAFPISGDAKLNSLALSTGGISKYKGVTTVSGGVPAEFATVDLTAQGAAIAATTVYAVPASGAGMYRVSFVAKVTQAATTSSTLGGANGFRVVHTDADDSVVVTSGNVTNVSGATLSGNTTQVVYAGTMIVNAKASTNIQYSFDYTSSGVTPMQYNLHLKLEAL